MFSIEVPRVLLGEGGEELPRRAFSNAECPENTMGRGLEVETKRAAVRLADLKRHYAVCRRATGIRDLLY